MSGNRLKSNLKPSLRSVPRADAEESMIENLKDQLSNTPLSHDDMLHLIQHLAIDNQKLLNQYQRLLKQSAQALVKTLEVRDSYTYGHCMRVMEYSLLIGRGAGLSENDMTILERSAMFHDLGKVGTPDCVLLKPERLTKEEQKIMAEHPLKSAEIIDLIDEFRVACPGVKHHHERFDGEGYPLGLSGNEIPLASRIILVADTFDAMTSNRPYRKALSIETAYDELRRFSGVQFDPKFVEIFLREHQNLTIPAREKTRKKEAA